MAECSKEVLRLARMHPNLEKDRKLTHNPSAGHFWCVKGSRRLSVYLYHFDKQLKASNVTRDYFAFFARSQTGCVFDQDIAEFSIQIELKFIGLTNWASTKQNLLSLNSLANDQTESPDQRLAKVQTKIAEIIQQGENTRVIRGDKSEDFLNSCLVDQLRAQAELRDFTIVTNKSVTVPNLASKHYSRFATSKPDLMMYSGASCSGVVITQDRTEEEEVELFGAVAENKVSNPDPEAQLFGNMEKLAGAIAFEHLENSCLRLRYITIFGLIITYSSNLSTAYKMTMDFDQGKSCLTKEYRKLPINHNMSKLVHQMDRMQKSAEKGLPEMMEMAQ